MSNGIQQQQSWQSIPVPESIKDRVQALRFIRMCIDNRKTEGMEPLSLAVAKKFSLEDALPDDLKDLLTKGKPAAPTKLEQEWSILQQLYLDKIITQDSKMLELKRQVNILAPLEDSVLIIGETGTGKELIAKALHGARNPDKFIDINCAGMPKYLIESELFGHVKGAFTGADKDKTGLMEEAAGGTLFLDEVGDLAIGLQAKLLRALQEKRIRKVGSNKYLAINCRVVSATHHELKSRIETKQFRDDLYYRLSTFELHTVPLRDRPKDFEKIIESLDPEGKFPIREWIDSLWQKDITASGTIHPSMTWSSAPLTTNSILKGNYRELQQIVKRYLVLGIKP